MPNYADPFGTLGSYLGGAAGGAAGAATGATPGLLGKILAPLDYPRQALWNAVRSGKRALTGEGTWDDALAAVPGALGGLGAAGLIMSGYGAPAGIAMGSLLGGLSQGIGKSTGNERYNAPEVSDLTGTDAMVPNMIVGALTDPLTYAGGIGGAAKGAEVGGAAGRSVGRGLETAALQRGPMFGGGAATLNDIREQAMARSLTDPRFNLTQANEHIDNALNHPEIFGELPKRGKLLGSGESTLGIGNADNPAHVVTIRSPSDVEREVLGGPNVMGGVNPNMPPPPRPDIAEMLQASRSKGFQGPGGDVAPVRVEHTPFLQSASLNDVRQARELEKTMIAQGMNPWDLHSQNVGLTDSGRMLVRDANAVAPAQGTFSGEGAFGKWNPTEMLPTAAEVPQGQPGMIQNLLLNMLGSDKSVQQELSAQLAKGPLGGTGRVAPMVGQQSIPMSFTGGQSPTDVLGLAQQNVNARLDRLAGAGGRPQQQGISAILAGLPPEQAQKLMQMLQAGAASPAAASAQLSPLMQSPKWAPRSAGVDLGAIAEAQERLRPQQAMPPQAGLWTDSPRQTGMSYTDHGPISPADMIPASPTAMGTGDTASNAAAWIQMAQKDPNGPIAKWLSSMGYNRATFGTDFPHTTGG